MAFLSKSVSQSLYHFELIYHGPFLLATLWCCGFLTGSFLSWTLALSSTVSSIYAIYGLNKFLNGLTNHIYEPTTRHLREAVVDTVFNILDLLLKIFTAYVLLGHTFVGSGLFTPGLEEAAKHQLSTLQAVYLTGVPLFFTHLHHFLLEGKARPVSEFLSRPSNNIFIGASFALLQLLLNSPLLLVFGAVFYLSVSLFMVLDVTHTMMMMLHIHNNPKPTLQKKDLINTSAFKHVMWETLLIVSHTLSFISWASIGLLSTQYLLQSLPALLGFALPGNLSGFVSPLLSSLGTTPIYAAATATFLCEGLRLILNYRSHYNHDYLAKIHRIRTDQDSVVPSELASPQKVVHHYAKHSSKDEDTGPKMMLATQTT